MTHPALDQFYEDVDFRPIKFAGYEDGHYLFHAYEKMTGRWVESKRAYKLHPAAFDAKRTNGLVKPSFPPQ